MSGIAKTQRSLRVFPEQLRAQRRSSPLLTIGRDSFPESVRTGCPDLSVLYAIGNVDLLPIRTVAIIGSRHSSDQGLKLAESIACVFAKSGIGVVSGYAKGVDTAAHEGALQCGGKTLFVLPFGLEHFRIKRSLRDFASGSNWLAISQFSPKQPWFASAAMKRNRLTCALASAVIVIEAGTTGGTFEGAKEARALGRPIYALRFVRPSASAEGNEILISSLAAQPLTTWRDINKLVSDLNGSPRMIGQPRQSNLF